MKSILKKGKWFFIKLFLWVVCIGLLVFLAMNMIFQNVAIPTTTKIFIPALLLMFTLFIFLFPKFMAIIKRRQQSLDTAKVLNQTSVANIVVSFILNILMVFTPLLIVSGIFVIGKDNLAEFGMYIFYSILILLAPFLLQLCLSITQHHAILRQKEDEKKKDRKELVDEIKQSIKWE